MKKTLGTLASKKRIPMICILVGVLITYLVWKHSGLFLSYLKVFLWPLVVFSFIYFFRNEIRKQFERLESIETPIASANFKPLSDQEVVEKGVTLVTEKANKFISVSGVTEVIASVTGDAVVTHADQGERQMPEMVEEDKTMELSRKKIEQYMLASAEWGYNVGLLGFKSQPIPKIEWLDGIPQIEIAEKSVFENKVDNLLLTAEGQSERDILIREILEVRHIIFDLSDIDKLKLGFGPSKLEKLNKRLEYLVKTLQKIDPDSVFLSTE